MTEALMAPEIRRLLDELTTADAGGLSPLDRLKSHMVGNSTSAKVQVQRPVLVALVDLAALLAASPVPEEGEHHARTPWGQSVPWPASSPVLQISEDPSVMGAGDGPSPMPLRSEAEDIWRRTYVNRMVERGIDRASAQACCDAGDADLSEDPASAADDELSYWENDDDV